MKSTGHTVTEYALCLLLLSVLAVGSLKLLGGNISDLLGTPTNSQNMNNTNQLYGLIGGSTAGNGGATSATGATSTYNLQVDPTTGQIVINDTAGGGKNTTSVTGSEMMSAFAQQMQALAEVKTADGQPLPDNIKAQILKLMQDGVQLSTIFAQSGNAIQTVSAANQTASTYPQALLDGIGSNINTSIQFQKDYNQLLTLLKPLTDKDPTLQDSLVSPINQLSGGITSINYNNLAKPIIDSMQASATEPTTFYNTYNNNPNIQESLKLNGSICNNNACKDKLKQALAALETSTLVGTLPTVNSTVTVALNPTTTATPASSTISGTIPANGGDTTQTSAQASIDITPDHITAKTTGNNNHATSTP